MSPGRTILLAPSPARLSPPPRRPAAVPNCPAQGMSEVWNRQVPDSKVVYGSRTCIAPVESTPVEPKTRTYYGRFGSGRPADGRAGSGRIGCQQNWSPRRQASLVPSRASKTRRLNVFPEARTSEILCKPNAGTKSAVDPRFIRGLSPGREALFLPGC